MNGDWFDRLARDVARGLSRREAVRILLTTASVAVFGSWVGPGRTWGASRAVPRDPDCKGVRTFYRPDCPKKVPKQNYQPSVNGCGPEGGVFGTGINAVPNSPLFLADFSSACDGHDRGYGTCNKPKDLTDREFLRDMYAKCSSEYAGSGMIVSMLRIQCKNAAQTYCKAVSDLGQAAYDAGQAAACDCCECEDTGGKCMTGKQYRMLKERVKSLCKYLQTNPPPPPGQGTRIPGANPGKYYEFTAGELAALVPVCVQLTELMDQVP
jgi:hypothetical protein